MAALPPPRPKPCSVADAELPQRCAPLPPPRPFCEMLGVALPAGVPVGELLGLLELLARSTGPD